MTENLAQLVRPIRASVNTLDNSPPVELDNPQFYKPQTINMLIGAEAFFQLNEYNI
jgi:hypothetical protein